MKLFATLAAVLLAASACEKSPSKLDAHAKSMPTSTGGAAVATVDTSKLEARIAHLEQRIDLLSKVSGEATGTPEERLRRLEMNYAQYADALDFLQNVYDQQAPSAPDAVYAVDIAKNLEIGQYEGPKLAPITIVEAWDFA